MTAKVILPEELQENLKEPFEGLMSLIPAEQRNDKKLKRLIAIRLKADGEYLTRDYIFRKISEARKCYYSGRIYDFFKNDQAEITCRFNYPDPPEAC